MKKVVAVSTITIADLVINSTTPIFTNFYDGEWKNFHTYFNTSLNPDVAPTGFLEQLSDMLLITKYRQLRILPNSPNKLGDEMFDVIKEYIESQ